MIHALLSCVVLMALIAGSVLFLDAVFYEPAPNLEERLKDALTQIACDPCMYGDACRNSEAKCHPCIARHGLASVTE